MDFFDSEYFRFNKLFLSFIGLWPYQTPIVKFLALSLSLFGGTTALIPQVIYFFKHLNNLDELFEVMPVTCGTIINLMKVICITCTFKQFKAILRLTQEDWCNLKSREDTSQEMQILTSYAEISRKFAIVYSYGLFIVASFFALMPLVSIALDIILPMNETRPRILLYPADYLVNQEKYYYAILLSEYFGYIGCAIFAMALDTTYFLLMEHICGMQAILCHSLTNLKIHYKFRCVDNDKFYKSDGIGCHVRHCIQLEKRIRLYIELVKSVFTVWLLFEIVIGVILHACTCIMMVIRAGRSSEIARFVAIIILQSFRLFFISWTGQEVIDHSSDIPIATYNAIWYLMPIKVQKILMLMITRSQKSSRIVLAGVYVINLENFCLIMKTSISYCMVMISLRETMDST